jgi:hypothetical protein
MGIGIPIIFSCELGARADVEVIAGAGGDEVQFLDRSKAALAHLKWFPPVDV